MRRGSIHLFRFAGVDLFLHWSWFLVAAFEIGDRGSRYSSIGWNILEYLTLFAIVTIHEYGHALACRQVGGRSDHIVLWPLGGVAFVDPPPRPGATLWSIAAGPLVNVALLPLLSVAVMVGRSLHWAAMMPNFYLLLRAVWFINTGLLVFNMLPIYPLDGGQILRSLLWFVLGRARSLMAATVVGFAGVAGLIAFALWIHSVWFAVLSAFILITCWSGLRQAQALLKLAKLPRHLAFICPTCKASPPIGNFWKCAGCGTPFDTFQNRAMCPRCSARFPLTTCLDCHRQHPIEEWSIPVLAGSKA